ncbi:metal dependent phosphohydrolase [Sporocytophaga myxococcoides]|uniref:Metal dependent phosphohydrolase n=1 Tax=Sporocytophaga myxococcoides TaxID=153721 RepID=A0A098LFH9_9BACT|nr:Pycsar system effector family protein [Sporocytophaga myxococcoides]GAL84823.1 metal dependent phosphohydrolase [Sporocytophaga myxococcoides]
MEHTTKILGEVVPFVFNLLRDKLSPQYLYHNFYHTSEIVKSCNQLGKLAGLGTEELEILELAAWFHDTGFINGYKDHEIESMRIAEDFLTRENYDKGKTAKVLSCIKATSRSEAPQNKLEMLLCDADFSHAGDKEFTSKTMLLKLEWENIGMSSCSDEEWDKNQLKFLSSVSYYTREAEELYGAQRLSNIVTLKKRVETNRQNEEKKNIKGKKPKRGIETMFRSVYRNHINLSSIADNKANMMISINTIIISLMLTVVGAKFSFFGTSLKENPALIFPAITLIATSLGSVIFAIQSAKPKVTNRIERGDVRNDKHNLLFFGNFTHLSLSEFEVSIMEVMKEDVLLYSNMINDLYYLGLVLQKKYKLLRYSYTFFMVGLIVTVFVFISILIYLKIGNHPIKQYHLKFS